MEVSGLLSGGAPLIKKYQINATVSNTGIPLLVGAADEAGLDLPTTTVAADVVGLNLDTAVFSTTQGSGENSAERLVSVVINPDAILRARMSGGAAEGTALALQTVTVANAGGTVITTGAEWSNPEFDEGIVWGFSGSGVGQERKITDTSATAGTVLVPFDFATIVGDEFLRAPYWAMQGTTVQLTTLLTEADASIAVGTGAGFKVIDTELGSLSDEGRTNSFVHMIPTDHFLSSID